jgi:hypothetical protein
LGKNREILRIFVNFFSALAEKKAAELVAELMKNKAHLTYTGMDEIRKIKGGMNTARKLED